MTETNVLPIGQFHERYNRAYVDENRTSGGNPTRFTRAATQSLGNSIQNRRIAVLPWEEKSNLRLAENPSHPHMGGGSHRPSDASGSTQRRRPDSHEIIRRIIIGGVILLVFVTAFRVVFYWGEKSAMRKIMPSVSMSPKDEVPPIWWR